jgi:hypothetical protein
MHTHKHTHTHTHKHTSTQGHLITLPHKRMHAHTHARTHIPLPLLIPSQIPHYNLETATESVKPVMGPYYREPVKSSWFPIHLLEPLVRSFQNDHYVEDEGELEGGHELCTQSCPFELCFSFACHSLLSTISYVWCTCVLLAALSLANVSKPSWNAIKCA